MNIYHNSQQLKYRRPFGAVQVGTPIYLAIEAFGAKNVLLCMAKDGQEVESYPMERSENNPLLFEVTIDMPEEAGLCWYYFQLDLGSNRYYYGTGSDGLGGEGSLSNLKVSAFRITVYESSPVPEWYKNGVVYQIFPDRFARGDNWYDRIRLSAHPDDWQGPSRIICQDWNDKPFYTKDSTGAVTRWPFFCGTLKGIREKLSYLETLGISIICLNPIFEATSNHRYDTADYMKIDTLLGDEDDFRLLCSKAKEHGIRIILDGVFNRTGRDSKYFDYFANYGGKGAYWDIYSPYRSWYRFIPEEPGYDCWHDFVELPKVSENGSSYQEFICGENGVIRHWIRLGASGWRLDSADDLPDLFVEMIREAMKAENPDSILIGDVKDEATTKISDNIRRKYFSGRELDSTVHYPFMEASLDFVLGRINSKDFTKSMMDIAESYPKENFYACLNLAGSHDSTRLLTFLGEARDIPEEEKENFQLDDEHRAMGLRREALVNALRFAMPGVPSLYYGDEAGMEGLEAPYCRGAFPWGNEDKKIMKNYSFWTRFYNENQVLKDGEYTIFENGKECVGITRFYYGEDFLSDQVREFITVLVNRSLTQTAYYEGHHIEPLQVLIIKDGSVVEIE